MLHPRWERGAGAGPRRPEPAAEPGGRLREVSTPHSATHQLWEHLARPRACSTPRAQTRPRGAARSPSASNPPPGGGCIFLGAQVASSVKPGTQDTASPTGHLSLQVSEE